MPWWPSDGTTCSSTRIGTSAHPISTARAESNEAKRKQMYGEMQVLVADEGGIGIPSFISLLDANDKRLKGLGSIPTGAMMGFSFAEHVWWTA